MENCELQSASAPIFRLGSPRGQGEHFIRALFIYVKHRHLHIFYPLCIQLHLNESGCRSPPPIPILQARVASRKGDRDDADDDFLINPLSGKQLPPSQPVYYLSFARRRPSDATAETNLKKPFSFLLFVPLSFSPDTTYTSQ